ncbi:hypothetical protein FRC12_010977 [Ceratobasidium sp. 428]|nr:hypothetical protein FRC12_010977 [Ceratobasidium sp. 428]
MAYFLQVPRSLVKEPEEVERFCPEIPKVVIGCKSDFQATNSSCHVENQLSVLSYKGVDRAKRIGARHYVECSAQKHFGIGELLECIGSTAWEIHERNKMKQPAPANPELQVTVPRVDASQSGGTNVISGKSHIYEHV